MVGFEREGHRSGKAESGKGRRAAEIGERRLEGEDPVGNGEWAETGKPAPKKLARLKSGKGEKRGSAGRDERLGVRGISLFQKGEGVYFRGASGSKNRGEGLMGKGGNA